MRKYMTFIILCLTMSIAMPGAHAQVTATVTIENQFVTGTDLYFDIYIKTTTGSSGDLYLDNADFVLEYNDANFTSPTLTKVPNPSPPGGIVQNGYNTFVSTTHSVATDLFTQLEVQKGYYDETKTDIKSGFLLINLDGVKPETQSDLDIGVAVIDGSASTHCLGRFKLSGITDPGGTSGLLWVNCAVGFSTKLFTLDASFPFGSTQVICTDISTPIPTDLLLPLEMASFAVIKHGTAARLDWATSTEMNTDFFNIERSQDAENWALIGQVQAAGLSHVVQKYQYLDRSPLGGINYYRLRMVDEDGTFEYSNIEAVMMEERMETGITLSPNPATSVLGIELHDFALQPRQILVQNIAGQVVVQENVGNQDFVELSVSSLPAGAYILTLRTAGKVTSERFVKQY